MNNAFFWPIFALASALAAAEPKPGDADYPAASPSARHEEKVKAVKSGDYDLVLIGDSITHTIGELGGKYEPLKAVWDRHFAPRRAINLGHNGYRTENILWNLLHGELDFARSPKVFMILIGTNNTDDRHFPKVHTPEEVFAGTKAIVDLIRQRHPASRILLLRIFPRGGDHEQGISPPAFNSSAQCIETCRRAGELTAQLADGRQVFWLDINQVFLRPDGKINTDLMWDLLHPGPAGTEAWVQAAEPMLAQLMGDQPMVDEPSARGLVARLLPGQAQKFVLENIPKDPAGDVFEIETRDGRVILRGNNGVSHASALNWYLKHYCHCQISLWGSNLALPDPLPVVPGKVRQVSPFKYRYYLNFCAFSYSLPWYDWAQWERLIDWMALEGINMPLSVTGQEAIWRKVYHDLGLTDRQLEEFFVGPAYLPFGWMGCIDAWGGPLPQSWIDRHLALQKRIAGRQRELGMTPVLQGFTGHVPAALTNVFPQATLHKLPSWCDFPPTRFLDPSQPLFVEIGRRFIAEQTREFGTDHLYASDTFIEMPPPSNDPPFLAAMGKGVYEAMRAGDPEAIWVMQGWVFHNAPQFWQPPQAKALLGAVPDDRMILLDLYCEQAPVWSRTEAFYGKPWLYCLIQDFGGVVSLHGGLPQIADALQAAKTSPQRGRLTGIGFVNEALGYNPVVNSLMGEMAWRAAAPDLKNWVPEFALSRYGRLPAAAAEAWSTLRETAYREPNRTDSLVCNRPAFSGRPQWAVAGGPYEKSRLAQAWQKLLACGGELGGVDAYRFDLVHVGRHVLDSLAAMKLQRVARAYELKDRQAFGEATARFLELLRDLDRLLGTREEFLLGRWLADARQWAGNDEERRLYEWNARNLITLWGPRDGVLHEYAQRQWSGLITGFYLPRWELFFRRMGAALEGGAAFDSGAFEQEVRDLEVRWTRARETYATAPQGDPVALGRQLCEKYLPDFAPNAVSLTTGKPATCSAALPGHPASLANDGFSNSTEAYWATDVTNDPGAWWQVDFGQPTQIGRVVVVGYYGDRRHYGFKLEVSHDARQWELVADRREQKEPAAEEGYACVFPPRTVRYLRVTQTLNSANTGRHLVEVMAFEK